VVDPPWHIGNTRKLDENREDFFIPWSDCVWKITSRLQTSSIRTGGIIIPYIIPGGTSCGYDTETAWWYTYPSEKYESQMGVLIIPNIWKNNPNVPNHQPELFPVLSSIPWFSGSLWIAKIGRWLCTNQHMDQDWVHKIEWLLQNITKMNDFC